MSRRSASPPLSLGCHIGFEGVPDPPVRLCGGTGATWTDLDRAPTDRPLSETGVRDFLLLARTPADLRRAVPLADLLPRARAVTVVIVEAPAWRPAPVPVPDRAQYWNRLLDLRIRRGPDDSWRIELGFVARAPAGGIVKALARGLTGLPRGTLDTPVVSLAGAGSCHWRPGDPNVTLAPLSGPVPGRRDAPGADLVLRTPAAGAPPWQAEGPRPVDRAAPARDGADPVRTPYGGVPGPPLRPDDLPPVDEVSVCPIGFVSDADGPLGEVRGGPGGYEIAARGEAVVRIPFSGTLTDTDVARVRGLAGVTVDLSAGPGGERPVTAGLARIVCGLAAAGVPVAARPDARWSGVLGPELAGLLDGFDPGDVHDPLARELYSIRLRRAALAAHGTAARWRSIAALRGIRPPDPASVSVLLCTRRPDLVGSALSQVARQRGVETEVILTLHGFTADLPEVAAAVAAYPGTITVAEEDTSRMLGEVLNRAAGRASGRYLTKMDDDDWYGPDHLSDLLLAQRYSCADLVGAAPEFYYLEPLGVTVRRTCDSEVYAGHVAGSSMLISRAVFDGVGGFRPIPRTVDGQLLESVAAAGGRIYRTHGLNYLIGRRSVAGHTWQKPVGTFLQGYRRQWRGFYANPLMEIEGPPAGEHEAHGEHGEHGAAGELCAASDRSTARRGL